VLKICTDTYKIIDKNIPLLTIRLGGEPCERGGGLAGWLGVQEGARGGGGIVEEEARGASGATRTWPPPWPPRGRPPPVGQSGKVKVDTPGQGQTLSKPPGLSPPTSLVLASPFSEWFSSLASASAFSFAFLVFLSSFLSVTAFSFYRAQDSMLAVPERRRRAARPVALRPRGGSEPGFIEGGGGVSYLCWRRLLGLWFQLGRARFLWRETGG